MNGDPDVGLEEAIAEVCGQLNVAHARLVSLLVKVLETGAWEGFGIRSPEHWVTWKTGVSPARAAELVRIARRSGELPATIEAFGNGELSVDQVSEVAKFAPAKHEVEICGFAKAATVSQIRSILRRYRFASDLEPAGSEDGAGSAGSDGTTGSDGSGDSAGSGDAVEGSADHADSAGQPSRADQPIGAGSNGGSGPAGPAPAAPAYGAGARGSGAGSEPVDRVHSHQGDDGRFHLHAELGALEGAEIQAALQEARDALFRAGNRDVTWADALVEVCRRSLAATGSVSRADNYRVYVHVDTNKAWVNAGPLLPESVRSRLLCDSTIHPYLVTGGKPISVGRVTHTIPRHTRRAVLDRDITCRFPGCNRRQLEVHHLVHREHGGHTVTENLAGFCSYHHHRHHDGTFRVSGNADEPDGLVFHRSDGTVMRPGPDPTRPQGPPPSPPPGHRYTHPAGERVQGKWVHFNETPTAA